MPFSFIEIVLVTPVSIKDSDCEGRGGAGGWSSGFHGLAIGRASGRWRLCWGRSLSNHRDTKAQSLKGNGLLCISAPLWWYLFILSQVLAPRARWQTWDRPLRGLPGDV